MNYAELITDKRQEIWRLDKEIDALKTMPPGLPIRSLQAGILGLEARTRGEAFKLMATLRPRLQQVEGDTTYYYWLISTGAGGQVRERLVWDTDVDGLGRVAVRARIGNPLATTWGQAGYNNLPLGITTGSGHDFRRIHRFAEDWEEWIMAYDLAEKYKPAWLRLTASDLHRMLSIKELHTSDALLEDPGSPDCPYYFRLERSRLGTESGDMFENQYDIVVSDEYKSGLTCRCELEARDE